MGCRGSMSDAIAGPSERRRNAAIKGSIQGPPAVRSPWVGTPVRRGAGLAPCSIASEPPGAEGRGNPRWPPGTGLRRDDIPRPGPDRDRTPSKPPGPRRWHADRNPEGPLGALGPGPGGPEPRTPSETLSSGRHRMRSAGSPPSASSMTVSTSRARASPSSTSPFSRPWISPPQASSLMLFRLMRTL